MSFVGGALWDGPNVGRGFAWAGLKGRGCGAGAFTGKDGPGRARPPAGGACGRAWLQAGARRGGAVAADRRACRAGRAQPSAGSSTRDPVRGGGSGRRAGSALRVARPRRSGPRAWAVAPSSGGATPNSAPRVGPGGGRGGGSPGGRLPGPTEPWRLPSLRPGGAGSGSGRRRARTRATSWKKARAAAGRSGASRWAPRGGGGDRRPETSPQPRGGDPVPAPLWPGPEPRGGTLIPQGPARRATSPAPGTRRQPPGDMLSACNLLRPLSPPPRPRAARPALAGPGRL